MASPNRSLHAPGESQLTLSPGTPTGSALALYSIGLGFALESSHFAVCAASLGKATRDTLYAGCKDGKIRSWKLGQIAASESGGAGALNGHEAAVRSLTTLGAVLYSGDAFGVVQAWDLSTLPTVHRTLPGHAAAVRAVAADPVTHFLYTGSEDTTIRVWHEGPPDAGASDMLDGVGGGRKGSLLGGRGRRR